MKRILFTIIMLIVGMVFTIIETEAQCTAVTGLSTIAGDRSAKLQWSPDPLASAYIIRGKEISQTTLVSYSVPAGSSSSFVSNLDPSTTYGWQIQKVCDSTSSDWSDPDTFTTLCLAPTNLNTANVTSTSATGLWSGVNGVTGYIVYANQIGTSSILSYNVSAPNISITNNSLTPATSYQWAIQSMCANGDLSPLSEIDTFSTPPAKVIFEERFGIYPNPSKGKFTLNLNVDGYEVIEIFNSLGQQIENYKSSLIDSKIEFEIKNPGIYFMNIYANHGVQTEKIIIE